MKLEDSIYYYASRLQSALSLIDKSTKIAKADKQTILDFLDLLRAKRVSTGRLAKYAYHLRTIAENLGTTFEKTQRKDIERLMIWIDEHGYSPDTISDFGMIIKRFFKFVRYGNLDRETPVPEEVRWISTAIKPNDRKQPELLTPQEVESLIHSADKLRDKCMISVGFEGGFRASELLLMNVGSVTFDEKGATVRVGGKTGARVVRLISSVPILARYLETHPLRNNPSGPLWIIPRANSRKKLSKAKEYLERKYYNFRILPMNIEIGRHGESPSLVGWKELSLLAFSKNGKCTLRTV
jgi:integrase/recombinase XerD